MQALQGVKHIKNFSNIFGYSACRFMMQLFAPALQPACLSRCLMVCDIFLLAGVSSVRIVLQISITFYLARFGRHHGLQGYEQTTSFTGQIYVIFYIYLEPGERLNCNVL